MAISSARYTDLYDYARTAEQIDYDLMGQADRLANRLNYFEATCREGGFQVSSDSLGPAMRSYSVRALPVDQHVRKVGEDFQRADGAWGSSSWLPGWWGRATSWAERFGDWWKWIAALTSLSAYLVMTWTPVAGYAGKVLVFGPGWARQVLGLSPYLRHIKVGNLLAHTGKSVWVVGPWFLIGAIIESAGQWMKDIKEYQGDLVRMINAIAIDTEVAFATMGVAAAVTIKIAALIVAGVGITGTAGPILVAVGVGLVVGLAADWMLDKFYESEFRLDAIEWLTDKEYDLVNFLDARVDEFLGRDIQPMPEGVPIPMPRPTPTPPIKTAPELKMSITPRPIPHLSQLDPQGDELLNFTRYENPPGSGQREFEPGITTVRDHIAELGCLMTDYTMLLNGNGIDIEVTDLYLSHAQTNGTVNEDTKTVIVNNLYTTPESINTYLNNQGFNFEVVTGNIEGLDKAGKVEELKEQFQLHGPLIVHVESNTDDGHWIVVSGVDEKGSIIVLDPLETTVGTIDNDKYVFFSDGEIKYLREIPAI